MDLVADFDRDLSEIRRKRSSARLTWTPPPRRPSGLVRPLSISTAAAGVAPCPMRADVSRAWARVRGGRWLGLDRGPAALPHRGDGRAREGHHHAQRVSRHFLRPVDQSLSRLRAWLRLLLRAADPRLSWACPPVSISRPGCSPSPMRRRCSSASWRAGLQAAGPSPSAPTPTPTSRSSAARRIMRSILEVLAADQPSGRHRHQVGAGRARHRHSGAAWRDGARQGRAVRDHARPQARPHAWSRAPRRRRERLETIRQLAEAGIPTTVMVAPIIPSINDMEIERILDAARMRPERGRPAMCCCGCRSRSARLLREWLRRALSRQAATTSFADAIDARRQGL